MAVVVTRDAVCGEAKVNVVGVGSGWLLRFPGRLEPSTAKSLFSWDAHVKVTSSVG